MKGRRRRGAISAEVYTEEDAASYVRKVPARGDVSSDERALFPAVNTNGGAVLHPCCSWVLGAGFCNKSPSEEASIVIIKQRALEFGGFSFPWWCSAVKDQAVLVVLHCGVSFLTSSRSCGGFTLLLCKCLSSPLAFSQSQSAISSYAISLKGEDNWAGRRLRD